MTNHRDAYLPKLTPPLKMILDRVEADRKDSVPDEVTFAKVMKVCIDPFAWAFGT